MLGWVERNRPHVLALQETMVADAAFPHRGFERLGYAVAPHGRGGRGGVALASRVGLDDVSAGVEGALAPFDQPRLVAATCAGVRVRSVYAPNGTKVGTAKHEVKLAWFEFLEAVMGADLAGGLPVVLAGDLNIAPTDADVWDAHRYRRRNLTSPAERAAFASLLDVGLVDIVRVHAGDRSLFTWWNRRGDFYETDRGWRLDHLLVTRDLAPRVTGVEVDRAERAASGVSDHAPLTMTLDWPTSDTSEP